MRTGPLSLCLVHNRWHHEPQGQVARALALPPKHLSIQVLEISLALLSRLSILP